MLGVALLGAHSLEVRRGLAWVALCGRELQRLAQSLGPSVAVPRQSHLRSAVPLGLEVASALRTQPTPLAHVLKTKWLLMTWSVSGREMRVCQVSHLSSALLGRTKTTATLCSGCKEAFVLSILHF